MVERDAFRIDQCLFGYADGHRLLESSIRLPPMIASDLTAASDLAPGARFAGGDGYWTGIPVPKLERYGLMHTWPAPEMPRPGCVWTHLLLLDPKLFELIDDLSSFQALMRRPATPDDCARYARPIAVPSSTDRSLGTPQPSAAFPRPGRSRTIELLEVLYGGVEGPVEVSRPGELDHLVLAMWSQQWPRLRRNFRFQTAASSGTEGTNKMFDLQLRIAQGSSRDPSSPSRKSAEWLEVAADDVERGSDSRLRTFLWRYGQDVKRQRGSFRPLTQLFTVTELAAESGGKNVPASVAKWFPDFEDASTLKHDMVNGVIFGDRQIDAIRYLCEVDEGHTLPAPSKAGLHRLASNWPTRSVDIMRLAEWAATEQGELADALLSTVARIVPASDFWSATEAFPEMRRRMVASQPNLLDSDRIVALDMTSLNILLDAIPTYYEAGAVLVRRLPPPVDGRIVMKACERFPEGVLMQAIVTSNNFGVKAAEDWLRAAGRMPSRVLDPAVMGEIRRTSVLLALAEALDWLSDIVVAHGLLPWTAGLADAQDDLTQEERDRFEAFLFALAVSVGGETAQTIFERSFGYLHKRAIHSDLSRPAQKILQPTLPNAGFFRDWDDALKLRLAVAQAYVRYDLDAASFARLLRDKRERKMLRSAAEEIPGGEIFTDALRV